MIVVVRLMWLVDCFPLLICALLLIVIVCWAFKGSKLRVLHWLPQGMVLVDGFSSLFPCFLFCKAISFSGFIG